MKMSKGALIGEGRGADRWWVGRVNHSLIGITRHGKLTRLDRPLFEVAAVPSVAEGQEGGGMRPDAGDGAGERAAGLRA